MPSDTWERSARETRTLLGATLATALGGVAAVAVIGPPSCEASAEQRPAADIAPSNLVPADSQPLALAEMLANYEIVSWTENDQSCDQEGPNLLESKGDKFFAVLLPNETWPGVPQVAQIVSCKDPAECDQKKTGALPRGGEFWTYFEKQRGDALTADIAFAGYFGRVCEKAELRRYTLRQEDGELVFELRGTRFDYAAEPSKEHPDSFECESDRTRALAEGRACNHLVTIRGRKR